MNLHNIDQRQFTLLINFMNRHYADANYQYREEPVGVMSMRYNNTGTWYQIALSDITWYTRLMEFGGDEEALNRENYPEDFEEDGVDP